MTVGPAELPLCESPLRDGLLGSAAPHAPGSQALDLDTVLEISQAVSGEMALDRLIEKLMMVVLEHACATRAVLVMIVNGESSVAAEAATVEAGIEVWQGTRAQRSELPSSLLRYVTRTQTRVLTDDTIQPHQFSTDPYLVAARPRCMLCLPLTRQSQLTGLLYVENRLASHVFTPARLTFLSLLASQAAISLENARLYTELKRSDAYLTEAQRLSRTGSFGWNIADDAVVWSDEMYELLEYPRCTPPSMRVFHARVHPVDRPTVEAALDRAARGSVDWDLEFRGGGQLLSRHVRGAMQAGLMDSR